MKCPQCSRKQRRGSEGMTCRQCKREFILDPKQWTVGLVKMTDEKFLAILRRATGNGQRHVTENELYLHAFTKVRPARSQAVVTGVVGVEGGALFLGGLAANSVAVSIFGLFALGVFTILLFAGRKRLSRARWKEIVATWLRREPIPLLLQETSLDQPPPAFEEPDLYDYGVEKIVICERDLLVDWLVKNGFHTAQKALVISESGYPTYLAGRARDLMTENPDLPILLLHDASTEGEEMAARLQASELFPLAGRKLIDLGLHPKDVRLLDLPPKFAKQAERMPVDSLPYPMLAGVLTVAALEHIDLATAAAQGKFHGYEVEAHFG